MSDDRISVIGLGKLGVPIAACLARRGFEVVAADVDPARVDAINRGEAPIFEPGLAEAMQQTAGRLRATVDVAEAAAATDITFLIVPTPSEPSGGFSLKHLLSACQDVGRALRERDGHLVSVTSTVMPGSTGGPIRQALEEASGKRCGRDFGLCYSPEFVALGSVIRDFLYPDLMLVGESDPASGARLEAMYRKVIENSPPFSQMNWVNAELTKLAVNTFVTTKITFANLIARLCERLPGADVDAVTGALGLDSRIGRKYLKGAVGYGGPCFPRDNLALGALARERGVSAILPEATDRMNRDQVEVVCELVRARAGADTRIGVLGLAYKPDTDVVEESQGMLLAGKLAGEGRRVIVFDPRAAASARRTLSGVAFAGTLDECVAGADILILATPWPEFRALDAARLAGRARRPVVIDCWRMLDRAGLGDGVEYLPLGVGPEGSGKGAQ